jgi:oxygen-independent coproporphyrinogen III oxidase
MARLRWINCAYLRPCSIGRVSMGSLMLRIADLFSAQVPRYTSYPTAPHFNAGVNEAVYGAWLSRLDPQKPLSLYIHIPFCDTLCWFCGCHTAVVNNYGPVRDYCRLIVREIELVTRALPTRMAVEHIHWGGGSPTLLNPDDIRRLDQTIRTHFDVARSAEFAVEVDPRGLSQATVDALAQAGLTRASIGVQDCNPAVQRAINRIQSDEDTIDAIEMFRTAGVASLNLDLLYGLPKQSLDTWQETLDFACWLNPDRLAVFGYAHVPGFKKHQNLIAAQDLPGLEARFQMAEMASQYLSAQGYVRIGFDHYARASDSLAQALRAGTLVRNFQGYTTDQAETLIGFGASSIGSLPDGYVQNVAAVPAYRASLAEDKLPVARGFALSEMDRVRRDIIQQLMCNMRADIDASAVRHHQSPSIFADALRKLEPLRRNGVVVIEDGKVAVPENWACAVRLAASAFDQYLPAGTAIHSAAI